MTTDFIPDKAYLIKSKSLEEVKHGVKEWVRDNNLEIVIDKKNEIGADRKNFLLNYEIWVHAKLVPSNNGTIVIFGQEYNYFYSGFTVYGVINWINFGLGYYMQELRKNLIRFILNKKQIKIDFHKVQFNIFPFALAASIVFSLAILYSIE
ncbi:MAG: hypothetical protein GYA51_11405, partial [Candidatus Methanofastidiosa archaeon]|nr:hypothetical protein [Candidatus Methanofastidiosa archaeon]